MTVSELIDELEDLNGEMEVYTDGELLPLPIIRVSTEIKDDGKYSERICVLSFDTSSQ